MSGLRRIRRSWSVGLMFVFLPVVACNSSMVKSIQNRDNETRSLEQAGTPTGMAQDLEPTIRENEQPSTTAEGNPQACGVSSSTCGSDDEKADNNPAEAMPTGKTATSEPFINSGIAVISPENVARLQDVAKLYASQVYWTQFSPDSSLLAAIAQKGEDHSWSVQLWDLTRGLALYSVAGGPGTFFSPDGSRLATAVTDEGFYLWYTAEGESAGYFESPRALALSPDWSTLVSNPIMDNLADSSVLLIIDMGTGSAKRRLEVPGAVVDARFSPDGRLIAITTGGVRSETTIWNVDQGERLAMLEMVDRIIFSPDGRLIAGTFGPEREIRLLDATDFSRQLILDNRAGPHPQMLAFSAGGEILAAALGNSLRLWDTLSGEELMSVPVQASNIQFSPDSRLLVTSNFQGEVTIWGVLE